MKMTGFHGSITEADCASPCSWRADRVEWRTMYRERRRMADRNVEISQVAPLAGVGGCAVSRIDWSRDSMVT